MPPQTPQQLKKLERLANAIDIGDVAISNQLSELEDKLDDVLPALGEQIADSIKSAVGAIPQPDSPEFPTSIEVSNLPELQRVQVVNFPEQKAPVVNVEQPNITVTPAEVIVDVNSVTQKVGELHTTTKEIKDILSIKEEFEPTQIYNKAGQLLDWDEIIRLLKGIRDKETGHGGGYSSNLGIVANTQGVAPLSGTSANGTVALTVADTWYAVPSTVPTVPYVLVVTLENANGTIRLGLSNSGTPSVTNGMIAPGIFTVRLAAGQVVYYGSSTAGDDVNWATKEI
jgi:hypothetical protein